MSRRVVFPFPAIVGMERAKLALLAVAVNPPIGGVLLRGDKGTGKTTLVRSFADVLPEIEVVADCPFQCHPRDPQLMCDSCYARYSRGETLPTAKRKMRVVDLPLSITIDRLVGTLDIKRALTEGIRALQPGLLAEANRNILYIDEVNLLDDYVVDAILDAAAYGWNVVEREGVSVRHPARFILVASMNPEEGELRPQLLDRFGLVVDVEAPTDPEVRAEIVRRVEEFGRDPEGFYRRWEPEILKLRERVERARDLVEGVEVSEDLLKLLAETVVKLNIRTSRAEIVTVRTAKALAALDGRTRVTMEDLQKAMELALPHRLRHKPLEPPRPPPRIELPDPNKNSEQKNDSQPQGGQEQKNKSGDKGGGDKESRGGGGQQSAGGGGGEEVRGLGDPGVDVKFSVEKRGVSRSFGLKSRASWRRVVGGGVGVPYMYLPKPGVYEDVDVAGTIVRSVLRGGGLPVTIEPGDVAVKVRRVRSPRVALILLDASGSMNFMKRIEVAKGLVYKLAEEAYVKRSYIGLVSFRGRGVDRAVGPTRNYQALINELQVLPSGGSTPLSAALEYAIGLLEGLRLKYRDADYWVYIITDGKANVPLATGSIEIELQSLAARLASMARVAIYDTRPGVFDPALSYIDLLREYAVEYTRVGDGSTW